MKSVTRKTALFLTLALSLATVGCGEDTPKAAESDQRELLNPPPSLLPVIWMTLSSIPI